MVYGALQEIFRNLVERYQSKGCLAEQPKPKFKFETFGIDDDIWKITYGTPTNYISVTDRGYTTEVIKGRLSVGTDLTTEDNARVKKTMLEALAMTKTAVPPKFEFLYEFMKVDPVLETTLQKILTASP